MTEAEELLSDWKAVYGELFPRREPDAMQYTDAMLALAVLLRREIHLPTPRTRVTFRFPRYNGISE